MFARSAHTHIVCVDRILEGGIAADGMGRRSTKHYDVHFVVGGGRELSRLRGWCGWDAVRDGSEVGVEVNIKKALRHGAVVHRSCTDVILTHGFDGTIPSNLITTVVVVGTRERIYHNPQAEEQSEDDIVDSLDGSGPPVEDGCADGSDTGN